MTFIQPNKKGNILNAILAVLCVALVAEVFGIVTLYNATVNLDHNITAAKAQLDEIGAQSTDLNNRIVATLNSSELAGIAAGDGLVAESHPEYFPSSWSIASQR